MPACLPLSMMTGWRQSHHPISLIMLFASGFVLTVSSVWAVALWIELTPRMMMVMVMAKVIRQRPRLRHYGAHPFDLRASLAHGSNTGKKLFPMIHKKLLGFASGEPRPLIPLTWHLLLLLPAGVASNGMKINVACMPALTHANTHRDIQTATATRTHAAASCEWLFA